MFEPGLNIRQVEGVKAEACLIARAFFEYAKHGNIYLVSFKTLFFFETKRNYRISDNCLTPKWSVRAEMFQWSRKSP